MLSERKRFNYNVGNTPHLRSHSKTRPALTPVPTPASLLPRDENTSATKVVVDRQNGKRIEELQTVNRRLIEETTSQFKRLESDVQRVEKILEEKEGSIAELEKEKGQLQGELQNASQEKQLLIEAIFQKDLIIKEYEAKLKELLECRERELAPLPLPLPAPTTDSPAQTDPLPTPTPTCSPSALLQLQEANSALQGELYEAQQQLFDARNRVKVVTQQFQAYKLLRQIESIEEI